MPLRLPGQRLNVALWRPETAMITMRGSPCHVRRRLPPRIRHDTRRPPGPACPAPSSAPGLARPAVVPVTGTDFAAALYCVLGGIASAFSALAFYAASPHCRWPRLRRAGRLGRHIGLVAFATGLWLWMGQLGLAAGLCVTLAGWMLAAMALSYLAAWTRPYAAERG